VIFNFTFCIISRMLVVRQPRAV